MAKNPKPQKTQPNNFNFADLVHEHDTFTDVDGTVYEFLDRMDFGAVELAKATRWQKKLPALSGRLQKNPDDENAAREMETISHKMVALILPDVPEERIESWTLRQRTMILEYWSAQQAAKEGQGKEGDQGEEREDQAAS